MDKKIERASAVEWTKITGCKTGRQFEMTKYMYGCLDPHENSPLSAVSITGNSISVDPWTGCSYQCAYCHVQGVAEDIDKNLNGKMRTIPIRRNTFSDEEILGELVLHPLFKRDLSVISIGTSSTEPFANGKVLESTLGIMEWFVKNQYRNPFWIVTKDCGCIMV